jgi:hypothetical protein
VEMVEDEPEHTCSRCHTTWEIPFGHEPTTFCHDCAHARVDELEAQLAAALERATVAERERDFERERHYRFASQTQTYRIELMESERAYNDLRQRADRTFLRVANEVYALSRARFADAWVGIGLAADARTASCAAGIQGLRNMIELMQAETRTEIAESRTRVLTEALRWIEERTRPLGADRNPFPDHDLHRALVNAKARAALSSGGEGE